MAFPVKLAGSGVVVSKRTRVPHGKLGVPYDAFGVFGATPPEKIGVFHPSSLKMASISFSAHIVGWPRALHPDDGALFRNIRAASG